MKRKLISWLLCAALICSVLPVGVSAAFTDIPDQDTALAAGVLQSMGIVSGVADGLYSPQTKLTRAQFCVFMVHTLGLKEQVNTYAQKALFRDVKPGNWYTGYVNLAYSNNLLSGYGNGLFGPDDPLTYGQTATLLLRLLGYTSAEVGKVWPDDYVNYAHSLELDAGVSLTANDPVTRGQAAILLYNTLNTQPKGSASELYKSFAGTASIKQAIILDTNARNGNADGQLMVCVIGQTGTTIEYYPQKNLQSDVLVGCQGDLLLNRADKVLGFMPGSVQTRDVIISNAKVSGITGTDGSFHKVTGSAVTIVGENTYTWNSTGYIQANNRQSRQARLYYNDNGTVSHVYISSGVSQSNETVAVAQTDTAASELARKLGVTGSYTVTKNGAAAQAGDLARYDVAYFDTTSRVLCVSDGRITGYIQNASPALDGAQTITVAGCTMPVLECAWEALGQYRLGDRVTLLLTDDGQVAAALSPAQLTADMVGVLSMDGRSVTLCGSGLVITAPEMDAEARLYGTLVRFLVYDDSITALSFTGSVSGQLDVAKGTLGSYKLAPACDIFESSGSDRGYVYSLDGIPGQPSSNFDELFWTDRLDASYIAAAHLNEAGQVDVLLLRDVTGNSCQYGMAIRYLDQEGIFGGNAGGRPLYYDALTITNANGESQKYLSAFSLSGTRTFYAVSLRSANTGGVQVTDLKKLSDVQVTAGDFFLEGDEDWYVTAEGREVPVSKQVQVYIEPADRWLSGGEGVQAAISSGLTVRAYYDRQLSTGGQVRVIALEA
ncbi:MAG: S-layer homology domain-containing protein [Oscillospiraceae bacterium]|nr:S-layer homology domain-containing protein [Oscillospiraceae bacterium]